MKIFALETDKEKLKAQFLAPGEEAIKTVYYHGLSFLFQSLGEFFVTILVFLGIGISWYLGWPLRWIIPGLSLFWFLFAFIGICKAYLDWCYDFILITSDKVVIVDQTAIFHQKITPIQLENIGSVVAETQYWGLLGFGIVRINLLEGYEGDQITLRHVPCAHEVAAVISHTLTKYQNRSSFQHHYQQPQQHQHPGAH